MKKTFSTALTLAAAGVLLWHTPRVSAQDDAPPPPPPGAPAAGNPGPGGPGGGANRWADFRQRMAERMKTALKASDDEWSVIQPLVEKVVTKQRESGAGMMGGMMGGPGGRGQRGNGGPGGPGGPGGGPRQQADNAGGPGGRPGRPGASPEAEALNEALQNDSTPVDQIKAKLAALREQRKKSAAELTQAREDLKKVLNMRQEATLVSMGILD